MDASLVPSIKCVLIGDYDVGKTSLINAFATREPLNQFFPGLTGPVQIHIEHHFRLYLLHVHDTDGKHAPTPDASPLVTPAARDQEPNGFNLSDVSGEGAEDASSSRHGSRGWIARRVEYGLADVILICFSLANRSSFHHVETIWRNELQQLCPHVPFLVIGCKLDLRRPDPTTPPIIQAPRHTSTQRFSSRRPKPVRSSTASTTASTSPTSSEFGHHRTDSSSASVPARPATTTSTLHPPPSSTTTSHDHNKPSSAPSSDVDGSTGKLKSKSSFPIPFPVTKALRRRSTIEVPTTNSPHASSVPPSSYSPISTRIASKSVENHGTPVREEQSAGTSKPSSQGNSPRGLRNVTLPPMLRSLSQAAVFRKVMPRPRSGTRGDGPSKLSEPPFSSNTGHPSSTPKSKPIGDDQASRPSLAHRHTSGSAGDTSVRNLHSHVRTTSQPTPPAVSADHDILHQQHSHSPPTDLTSASTPTSAPGSSPISPLRKLTRIEEPSLPFRHRTTTYQEARGAARRLGASGYIECSALTLVNVVKVFDEAVRIAVERRTASASSLHGRGRRGSGRDECIIL